MTASKTFNKHPKHKDLYHALIESILANEDAMDKGTTKSQSKSTGKSAQAEETVFVVEDTQVPQDLGEDMGNTNEPPVVKADPKEWSKKLEMPPTPDPEWNKVSLKAPDFPRLHLNDIEDMLLLVVQNRLFNLKGEDIMHLAKLNTSKQRTRKEDLSRRAPYTTLSDPQGVIYEDKLNRKKSMRSDKLYKFSDEHQSDTKVFTMTMEILPEPTSNKFCGSTGVAKRCVDRLPPRMINTWDLLKKAFVQRYFLPSEMTKQLEEIHNFKQEGDETLYQTWERYNDLLYKCLTHDLNSHQKINIFYKGLDTTTRQLLDSPGPIPDKMPAQTFDAIQTMAGHSHKWHDGSTSRCKTRGGAHLDKECLLREEVKSVEEVKSTRILHTCRYHPPFGEKKPSLEELMNKHLDESTRKRAKMEEWMKKLHESTKVNTRNQNASLRNLETKIEQLAKDYQARDANKVPNPSIGHCKAIFANDDAPNDETYSNGTNELHEVSFIVRNREKTWSLLKYVARRS
ncbi:putative ribonuclease H-like domain-containing protein [Tanacetum coccineum]